VSYLEVIATLIIVVGVWKVMGKVAYKLHKKQMEDEK
jgi:uncharacterized membrane protein